MDRNHTQIELARPTQAPLGQEWRLFFRYWLSDRRVLIGLAAALFAAALFFNWQWVVAAGLASLIIGVLPCVAMCAIGLCAMGRGNSSCSKSGAVEDKESPSARSLPTTKRTAEADQD